MTSPSEGANARAGLVRCLLGVAVVATIASCGSSGSSSTSTSSKQPTQNRATASAHRCQTSELRILPGASGVATGHAEIGYAIFNSSSQRCSLYGYPRITLLDANGKPLGLKVKPASRDFFGTVAKRVVIVPEGGLATFHLADDSGPYVNGDNCPKTSGMRVSFPPDPGSRVLRFGSIACPGRTTVSPVARNRSAYF